MSGQCDIIPVTIPKRMQQIVSFELGKQISIRGQFRSYNKLENEKSRLILTVFAKEIGEYLIRGEISKVPLRQPLLVHGQIYLQ